VLWIGKINSKLDFKSIGSRQASVMDDLRRLLRQGEYPPFSSALVFESKFVQVKSLINMLTKTMNHQKSSSSIMPTLGEIKDNDTREECPNPLSSFLLFQFLTFSLTLYRQNVFFERDLHSCLMMNFSFFHRLFPLKFVELSVLSKDKHQLMLKLVNGRTYCLELCAPPNQHHQLFHLWLRLISLMKPTENT
ncbi:Protein FAM71B, partial [Tauraco erythrolophus]